MRLVGTDRTLERGPVKVFLCPSGVAYVTSIDAPLGIDGCYMGLRPAPIGIEIAVAARHKKHRLHHLFGGKPEEGSKDFRPIKNTQRRSGTARKAPSSDAYPGALARRPPNSNN
jgi:hypothetical protein